MISQPLSPRVNIRPSGPSVPISAPAPVFYDESDTTRWWSVYYWKIQSQTNFEAAAEFRSRLNNNNNKKERVLTNKKKTRTYLRSATVYSRVNLSASSCVLLSCATPSRRSRGTSPALFVTFRSVSACSRRRIPSSRRSHFPRKNRSACRSKSTPFFGTRPRRRWFRRAATRTGASLGLCPCASCVRVLFFL